MEIRRRLKTCPTYNEVRFFLLDSPDLRQLLKTHWGYSEFRPRQEAIVQPILDGHDSAVVMPTGGGTSLCYQLPAVAMERTCVVISPLIALMQDQAASMREIGVAAGFLNSSLNSGEARETMIRAQKGELRLLYLSPERIVRPEVITWLRRVPVGFFAIDEAHCISEWGHEFRPEYRQLRVLREQFPDVPIAAFTASATRAVRHDILAQLQLREPAKFVMSFHRPNLRYILRQCGADEQEKLLKAALEWYSGDGNVILYAPTIKAVEALTEKLERRGIGVVAYHGKMESADRSANQEAWMSGEKPVLVGTVAFGLGINKPDVRAVIHLSMPKSLEQYYQEAGRAGRDGLEADCVMLWQPRDIGAVDAFCAADSGSFRERASLAALSHHAAVRGAEELQASRDLYAFWGDAEVDSLRCLRCVWGGVGLDGCGAGGSGGRAPAEAGEGTADVGGEEEGRGGCGSG